jgi:hypothetical protein
MVSFVWYLEDSASLTAPTLLGERGSRARVAQHTACELGYPPRVPLKLTVELGLRPRGRSLFNCCARRDKDSSTAKSGLIAYSFPVGMLR